MCSIVSITAAQLAQMIDHTLLKADASEQDIRQLCREALQYQFASVCVNAAYVALASEILAGSGIRVCCVVGFPLGADASETKAFAARLAVRQGAGEIDMVIDLGAIKSSDWRRVQTDIESVVKAARPAIVKVILETCLLNREEIVLACRAAEAAGAAFVKTSTGFSLSGADPAAVSLMRSAVGPSVGVKASGGIRDYQTALQMIRAGANRLGVSAGVAIMEAARAHGGG